MNNKQYKRSTCFNHSNLYRQSIEKRILTGLIILSLYAFVFSFFIQSASAGASVSIQSASLDKSTYVLGETVKVKVTIKNTGTVDLSNLKINVDIADPNGNNVIASTLKNGISVSKGKTYSTDYTGYYTIPKDSIAGTYKITVGLWNSDSSQQYDIKYRTASFNVKIQTTPTTPKPTTPKPTTPKPTTPKPTTPKPTTPTPPPPKILAAIQSASLEKSAYSPGETVKVKVTIKNGGTVDLSDLKINVDIADPNGNNVIASTLKNGISISKGKTYSTDYTGYYTIPKDSIAGTYKITVGLWNSDSSQQYDIKYRTASFNVKIPPTPTTPKPTTSKPTTPKPTTPKSTTPKPTTPKPTTQTPNSPIETTIPVPLTPVPSQTQTENKLHEIVGKKLVGIELSYVQKGANSMEKGLEELANSYKAKGLINEAEEARKEAEVLKQIDFGMKTIKVGMDVYKFSKLAEEMDTITSNLHHARESGDNAKEFQEIIKGADKLHEMQSELVDKVGGIAIKPFTLPIELIWNLQIAIVESAGSQALGYAQFASQAAKTREMYWQSCGPSSAIGDCNDLIPDQIVDTGMNTPQSSVKVVYPREGKAPFIYMIEKWNGKINIWFNSNPPLFEQGGKRLNPSYVKKVTIKPIVRVGDRTFELKEKEQYILPGEIYRYSIPLIELPVNYKEKAKMVFEINLDWEEGFWIFASSGRKTFTDEIFW